MIDIPDNILPVNEKGKEVCPKCKKELSVCTCPSYDPTQPKIDQFTPVVRLEKKGRKGKTVTLIEGLPRDESYLKQLAKKVKERAGSGGSFYLTEEFGTIEIQGDHRDLINKILE